MHAGTDSIPRMPVSRFSHGGMESNTSHLCQPCQQHGVTDRLREQRHHRCGDLSHGNGFRLPAVSGGFTLFLLHDTLAGHIFSRQLVGFLQQGHLVVVCHLRGLLPCRLLPQLFHLCFQRLLFGVFPRCLIETAERGVDVVVGGRGRRNGSIPAVSTATIG